MTTPALPHDSDALDQATAQFIFVVCQNGAESACKLEIMRSEPSLKLAFSRPGFITFKTSSDQPLPEKYSLRSALTRTTGWSLGKLSGEHADAMVEELATQEKLLAAKHLHVWQRDPVIPGRNGFEPGVSALASEVGQLLEMRLAAAGKTIAVNREAKPDDLVFDIVMVEPNQWWFGYHYANTVAGRWPGGTPLVDTTLETFSRAYFKLKEALMWSGITIQPGDVCAEIGSSPGGACQFLLEQGAIVIGVDPAEMEAELLAHPNFTHIRRKGNEVKKRDFRDVRWLMADINVDPNFTLDLVAEIVAHEAVGIKGVVLTLKLADWKLVSDVPAFMEKVRSMGFQVVKARQLAFNRQEFCLVGVKDKFLLRSGKQRRGGAKTTGGSKPVEKQQVEQGSTAEGRTEPASPVAPANELNTAHQGKATHEAAVTDEDDSAIISKQTTGDEA